MLLSGPYDEAGALLSITAGAGMAMVAYTSAAAAAAVGSESAM